MPAVFPQQDLQTCQRGEGPTHKFVNGFDKRSRRTIYRVHTPPQNLARHCVETQQKRKPAKKAALVLCGTGICFPIYTSDTHKRESLCTTSEWSFTGFLSYSIEPLKHMQMEGAV